MNKYIFSPLSSEHNKKDFDCNEQELNIYLKEQASQDMKRGIAHVMVLTKPNTKTIIGYYTLWATALLSEEIKDFSGKLPKYDRIPAVLLGRLAVNAPFQNQKLGSLLLTDAIKRAYVSEIAWHFFLVKAKNPKAKTFYQHFGFQAFTINENLLWLNYKEIKNTIAL